MKSIPFEKKKRLKSGRKGRFGEGELVTRETWFTKSFPLNRKNGTTVI